VQISVGSSGTPSRSRIAANRRIEAMWRRAKISYEAFDWWLRWMSGV
jgi:hypothetical protein